LGPNFRVLYSSQNGITGHSCSQELAAVEAKFGVAIVYGIRNFYHPDTRRAVPAEVVLIDVSRANIHPVNVLKAWMYDEFQLPSDRYEKNSQYEQYVRLAPAALAVLRALGASDPNHPAVLISHDTIGIPCALAANMDPLGAFKTIYFAHHVPTIRNLVETNPGHDTLLCNALDWAQQNQYYISELFGPQDFSFQHALTTAARFCDNIITISDRVKQELRFLDPRFDNLNLDTVYHGLSTHKHSLEQKKISHTRLQQYAGNLLGYIPDYIFTHTAGITVGKALWRDLRVLYQLEPLFQQRGQTGVYFLLSPDTPPSNQLRDIDSSDFCPPRRVAHRDRHWALSESEAAFYCFIQEFNARNQHIKAVLINPLCWEAHKQDCCMPPEMDISDLCVGSDLEFCQSAYEPFGCAPLQSVANGSLCVISNVCGCKDLLERLDTQEAETGIDNIITADYTRNGTTHFNRKTILSLDQAARDQIEERVSDQVARTIMDRLPQ
ncbi:MAG: hypothetical protein KAJ46_02795, partial [Sedimentisphaerales bacterium]|nr:hypothetical protein [Sedimentisphaerales bacterium]